MISRFWAQIKALRENKNISQETMAKVLDMSRITYAQIESNERDLKREEIKTIADFFELKIEDFLKLEHHTDSAKKLSKKDPFYKIKNLILYISEKLSGNQTFGKTVLNKLLYFCDFNYCEWTGAFITWEHYQKMPFGPVPASIDKILTEMQEGGLIQITQATYFWYPQHKIIPLQSYSLDFLDEIDEENSKSKKNYTPYKDLPRSKEIIDSVIQKFAYRNGEEIKHWSHDDIPYKATQHIGDTIDPSLVFYREKPYISNYHNLSDEWQG